MSSTVPSGQLRAVEQQESTDSLNTTPVQDESTIVERLTSRFQVTVFTLAMHLLNNVSHAEAVVEEVFVRLSKEPSLPHDDSELESLVHSTTYDVAIGKLVSLKMAEKSH